MFDQRELKFEVGDGESLGFPTGVEKAIMAMEEQEESLFIMKPKYDSLLIYNNGFRKDCHMPKTSEGCALLEMARCCHQLDKLKIALESALLIHSMATIITLCRFLFFIS